MGFPSTFHTPLSGQVSPVLARVPIGFFVMEISCIDKLRLAGSNEPLIKTGESATILFHLRMSRGFLILHKPALLLVAAWRVYLFARYVAVVYSPFLPVGVIRCFVRIR